MLWKRLSLIDFNLRKDIGKRNHIAISHDTTLEHFRKDFEV